VHRAGRTARAGKSGRCITLVTYRDELPLREIQGKFHIPLQKKELPNLEQVSQRVCERTTVLLEEQLRDAGSVMNERIDRFTPLAEELAQSDEGRRLLALLLDDFYHHTLHLPPKLPEEKLRFEDIPDTPGRPRHRERERDELRGRSERPRRSPAPDFRAEEGSGDQPAPEQVTADGEGAQAGNGSERPRRPRRRRGRGRSGEAESSSAAAPAAPAGEA
jgi:ATP-dependent RNA helicase DeaD